MNFNFKEQFPALSFIFLKNKIDCWMNFYKTTNNSMILMKEGIFELMVFPKAI